MVAKHLEIVCHIYCCRFQISWFIMDFVWKHSDEHKISNVFWPFRLQYS